MRYLFVVFLIVTFLAETSTAQSPPPPKRRPTKSTRVEVPKAVDLSLGAVVEKYVSNYDLNSDGTAREIREVQQRCLSEICVQQFASYKQVFNGDLQKMKVLDAYVVKADGTRVKVPQSGITDRPTAQAEAAPSFSSLREIEIKFDGLGVGDASYFKLETLTTRSTFDGRFDSLELFALVFDWKSIEINVTAPANYPIFTEAVGLDGGKLADENGRSRWQFRKQNIPKLEIEAVLPDVISVSPRFSLTTFRNPEELGAAYWENVRKQSTITPEVQALADEITKDITVPSQQAAAIYGWVNKNIRYLLIVLDRGGWVPHSAAEILKNGYGDCKDYTTIIHTLLKAKGIESIPVLIRSDYGDWFPSVATADYFNHSILYIPSMNLFADATMPNTRLGLIPQSIVGKKAILAGTRTGIIEVPKDNPADNQIRSDANYDFSSNGAVKARSRNTYVGRSEIIFRPLFGNPLFARDRETFVKLMLAYFGVEGDGKILDIGNPYKVGEPFSVEFEAGINNFTTFLPKGRLALPVGLNMIYIAGMEQFIAAETRRTNLVIGATKITENISVTLPSTVSVTAAPLAVSFANAAGSFRITPELKDGGVRFTRELVIAKDSIAPSDYPAFRELVRKLIETQNVQIDYTADPSLLRAKSKELKNARPSRDPSESFTDRVIKEMTTARLVRLPASQVRALEKKLTTDANDADTRIRLVRHYALFDTGKVASAEKALVQHRLWLVRNRPEIGDEDLYGLGAPYFSPESLHMLKTAWLEKVNAEKNNSKIRMNAAASIRATDRATGETLLTDGAVIEPENYKYPLLLTELKVEDLEEESDAQKKKVHAGQLIEYGKTALRLIKKERSGDRDSARNTLLRRLCSAAIDVNELDAASVFAKELILDFGQSALDHGYDEAAHVGNITLGFVELRRNNIDKAKEFLLIAIRAPLRKEYNALSEIDTRLASELYDKGEKKAVLEYLKLCRDLGNLKTYPESYADEIYALNLWIGQIEKGTRPNFNFTAPESRVPLPKSVIKPRREIIQRQE